MAEPAYASYPPMDRKGLTAVLCFGLVVLIALLFVQTGRHEFTVCDDNVYIYDKPQIKTGLTWESVKWAFQDAHEGNWHPLTWVTHMLDWQLFGLANWEPQNQIYADSWAGGHHLMNMAIHTANAVLLFLALRLMTGTLWPSFVVAVLFAAPSAAGRIGGLGRRTEGRTLRPVLDVVARELCLVRAAASDSNNVLCRRHGNRVHARRCVVPLARLARLERQHAHGAAGIGWVRNRRHHAFCRVFAGSVLEGEACGDRQLFADYGLLRAGVDGEVDDRHFAVCLPLAGHLAAGPLAAGFVAAMAQRRRGPGPRAGCG